jgi:hypothetical protein
MSFTGLKHLLYKEALDTYGTPIPKRKCTSHSMTDLPKVTEWVTRSAQRQSYFFALEKYRSIPIYFEN